jgi:4'-phosphopantetheinyl transferase EntD
MNLNEAFAEFLQDAQDDGWILGSRWQQLAVGSNPTRDLKRADRVQGSRTHKKAADGSVWVLDVEGAGAGVDLERLREGPEVGRLIANAWQRLGLPEGTSAADALAAFSIREAAFKALFPDNQGVLVSHFKSSEPGYLELTRADGTLRLEIRAHWCQEWVLTLARRI